VAQRNLINPSNLTAMLRDVGTRAAIGRMAGASEAMMLVELARAADGPVLVLANDPRHADQIEAESRWFAGEGLPVQHFVEWETLPWDSFSPHQDIVSQRLAILGTLPNLKRGIIVTSSQSLLQRLPPVDYVSARSLELGVGQALDRQSFVDSLAACGYLRVPQVEEHGELAVRGSLIDVFPMGSGKPIRIDFFDDEIESLRHFDAETQISGDKIECIRILPAREVPLDASDIRDFRHRYRERFEGRPADSRVYRDVSDGIAHGGIEYFLPLFFGQTANLLEYLPANTLVSAPHDLTSVLEQAWTDIEERYELCSLDRERPVLSPGETFNAPADIAAGLDEFWRIDYSNRSIAEDAGTINLATRLPPALRIETRFEDAAQSLMSFLGSFDGRVLFTADSPGRREQVLDLLSGRGLDVARFEDWAGFESSDGRIGVAVAPIEDGIILTDRQLAIISEHQLFGERPRQRNRRRRKERDPETIIRQLNDLESGSPVVHEEYGIGRYIGLVTLTAGGIEGEFLQLEYADSDKLYVPVNALDLISRYTGASAENAPLHRLGSDQWAKAKKKAINKIRDVAVELLDIYARRAARPGHRFSWSEADYRSFEAGFPFEPTDDQDRTIDEVLADLSGDKPMDRVVCGDVGFGKTEVALRATFAAVHGGKQVAILVPTTLLAQQHGQSFRDRFADWPVQIEVLSRFCSTKQAKDIVAGMRSGRVDVLIGTHRHSAGRAVSGQNFCQ
jgi:transcription-repair coupling factor (superfamily II helicase)